MYYLISKLDDIQSFMFVLSFLLSSWIIGFGVFYIDDYSEEEKKDFIKNNHIKLLIVVNLIGYFLAFAIPNTKQALFIYLAPNIVENENIKETVNNLLELSKVNSQKLLEEIKK